MFSNVKGTQDFLDMRLFNALIEQIRTHLHTFHFHEISTPILEYTDLFIRSLGTHTDVVSKEMFLIKTHNDDEESICLRPEVTAPTVRAFVEHGINTTPWKVFSWGPMFRYERPQKGRSRQFNQVNMEIIGARAITHDAYFLYMLDQFFSQKLHLNSYALTLNFLGCSQDREVYKKKLAAFLEKNIDKLCANCRKRKDANILRIFDCKVESCQVIYDQAPFLTDSLCASCNEQWIELRHLLDLLSVSYIHNPKLVRGLDYYNKTVFEFVSQNLGAQNTFCGGGRYDQLALELGAAHDEPSLGAAMGIERLLLLLESQNSTLPIKEEPALYVVLPVTAEQQSLALLVAQTLSHHGFTTDILLDEPSIKSMMRKANKMGAKFCLIIGPEEQNNRQINIKNMITGHSTLVPQGQVINHLRS